MEHQEIKDLFSPYLDDLLTTEDKKQFEIHLEKCPDCIKELNEIKTTINLLGSLPLEEPPYDIAVKVKKEILEASDIKKNTLKINYRYLSIAAAFLLILSLSFLLSSPKEQNIALSDKSIGAPEALPMQPQTAERKSIASDGTTNDVQSEHKIIKTADVDIRVKKYQDFIAALNLYLKKNAGYIDTSSINKDVSTNKYSASLQLRVPEKSFQATLDYMQGLGEFVRQNTGSQDVSTQYIDTAARIKTLETQITTLQGLLAKAKDVDEMLKVQNELTRVQGDHDALVGQNQYLDRASNFASIAVFVHEEDIPQDKIVPSEDKDIFKKAKAGFIRSVNNIIFTIQQFFVEVVSVIPQIIIALVTVLVIFIIRKITRKNK